MATYYEILSATENAALSRKIRVAVMVAADKIRAEPAVTVNHIYRLRWAQDAFADPDAQTRQFISTVLVQNRAAPIAQILTMGDDSVQQAVDLAIDVFATGT